MYTLRTGSDWNGLTVAELERAEKELPVSEVAKGGYPLSFGFPFATSTTRDLLTGKNLARACLLYLVTLSTTTTTTKTWNKDHKEKNQTIQNTTVNQVPPCQLILIGKQKMVAVLKRSVSPSQKVFNPYGIYLRSAPARFFDREPGTGYR